MTLQNALEDLALDSTLQTTRDNVADAVARLEAVRDRLPAALHADGGLKTHVQNLPADPATETTLAALLTELGQKLEPGQEVALDAATLAALESITVAVTGTVPVSGPLTDVQLRALEVAISAAALPLPSGAATDAVLQAVRDRLGDIAASPTANTVQDRLKALKTSVDQLHTDLVGTLTISGALTDTQLRASAVPTNPSGETAGVGVGAAADAEASGNGSAIALLKRLRTLLSGGLPAALSSNGGLKVEQVVAGPTQPISGTVTANAGTGTFGTNPTGETAGVGVGAAADAEASGNGSVIAVAKRLRTLLAGGLPAALTGTGNLKAAIVESTATVTTDMSDKAAREVGRARIWDGTDEATVIPRGTAPASTDKGVAVVLIGGALPSYQVVTNEITLATTTGVKECLNLWHPSSLTKDVFIVEIGVNIGVAFTVGRMAYELSFTSTIGTGGNTRTPQPLSLGFAASSLEAREVKTGGGALTGALIQRATLGPSAAATPNSTNEEGVIVFRAKDTTNFSDAIQLRSGQAEGLNIQADVLSALTGAPIITIYARYIERA